MARYCPLKNGPALYLDCKECDEKLCESPDAGNISGTKSADGMSLGAEQEGIYMDKETAAVKAKLEAEGMRNVILNALPQNVTNGDIIRLMFPDAEVKYLKKLSGINSYRVRGIDGLRDDDGTWLPVTHQFYEDWWNAPYKVEDNR